MRIVSLLYFWCLCLCCPAAAQTLNSIDYRDTQRGTQIEFTFTDALTTPPNIFRMDEGSPRLVIDWDNIKGASAPTKLPLSAQSGASAVRYAPRGTTGMRAVIDLRAGAKLLEYNQEPGRLSVWVTKGHRQDAVQSMPKPLSRAQYQVRYFENSLPYPRLKPRGVTKLAAKPPRKPVIVIDPGHGGRDPGAIGPRGTQEKRITLSASLELQKQLRATGKYEVIITRGGDTYVDHDDRLRIARAGGADLFISIHADSTEGTKARGASVYTLSDRSKSRSKGIVNNQNWIMDVDLATHSDPVGDILVDLAQRKTASQSAMFADVLITSLSRSTRLIGNTHRRAGYYVLLAPDVPAVLLELGFLSNPDDEKLLRSENHRKKLIRAVVSGINTYFDAQKP